MNNIRQGPRRLEEPPQQEDNTYCSNYFLNIVRYGVNRCYNQLIKASEWNIISNIKKQQ